MTWDPYGMPNTPGDPQMQTRDNRMPKQQPARVRTVVAILGGILLLALVFSLAANAQETTTKQEPSAATEQQGQQQSPDAESTATKEQQKESEATGTTQTTQDEAQSSEAAKAESTPLDGQIVKQPKGTYAASELIGRPVFSAEGENMGDITDLLFTEDNEIAGIVVGVGGFLGFGEKQIAVKLDRLKRTSTQEGGEQFVLDFARQELEQAPAFVSLAEQQRRKEAEQARQQQEQEMQQQQQGSGDTSGY